MHLHFGPGDSISPSIVSESIPVESDLPVAICSQGAAPAEADDEKILKCLREMLEYTGLTAFLLDGEARGWLIGLAATSDLVIASQDSKFVLGDIGEQVGGFAAARLAHLVGKARAMQVLIEGEVDVIRLQQWGLVTRLVDREEFEQWHELLEDLLPNGAYGAARRLKKVWTTQEGAEIGEALAAERLEFQRCFEEGAAEEIAAYLKNLKKN